MESQSRDPNETRITELEEKLKERMARIEELERDRSSLEEQVEKLTANLKKSQAELPRFPLESLASSFKTLIEDMQAQAIKPTPSGTTGALRSVDVELKGYVNVQDTKTYLVLPMAAGEAVDAQSLSLLKLSFVTVPTRPLPPRPPAQPPPKAPEQPPPKAPEEPPKASEQPPAETPTTESAAGTSKRRRKRSKS